MNISIKTNAKINLGLNVLDKRADGYHNLKMIMAPITLSDNIEISFYDETGDLEITTNNNLIPVDRRNIVYKIFDAYYTALNILPKKAKVHIEKIIPSEAGLGGGSSNGGFFMKELNKFNGNPLSNEHLINISKKIGADIPFFLVNETAVAEEIGDKLRGIENNLTCDIVLFKPNFGISTKEAYLSVAELKNRKYADIEKIEKGLKEDNLTLVEENIENIIHQGVREKLPVVMEFEAKVEKLLKNKKFFMSGSGSCYFALAREDEAKGLHDKLKSEFNDCFVSINKFCKNEY